jgi:hypothetical protein
MEYCNIKRTILLLVMNGSETLIVKGKKVKLFLHYAMKTYGGVDV